jgi:predicted acyltransferase
MAAYVDRLLLDGHLWAATRTWDPEGVLSSLPATGSVLLGVFAGRWIYSGRPLRQRVALLCAAGVVAVLAGLSWGQVFPINKNIWTSSYVIFSGGMAAIILAACMWIVEGAKATWWTRPFEVFGLNPLVAFVGSMLMARTIYSLVKVDYEGTSVPLQSAVYRSVFASWLAPANASLLFAISFVLLWLAILWLLARRNIVIRV